MADEFEPEIVIESDTVVAVAEPTDNGPGRGTAYGLVAILAAVVIGVAVWAASGDDSDGDEPAADEAEIGETEDDPVPAVAEDSAAVSGTAIAVSGTAIAGPGEGTYASDVVRVVPWDGGFLAVRNHYQETPLPEFGEDVQVLYPPEIAEAVQAAGATTIEEASAALEEAGLLEQAMEIFYANQGVLSDIQPYSVRSWEVVVSADGIEWGAPHPIEGDFDYVSGVGVGGGRLVLAVQQTDEEGQDSVPAVMVTDDLETWDVVDLGGVIRSDTPEFAQGSTWIGDVAVSDSGWFSIVQASTWIDMETLLPLGTIDDSRGYEWSVVEEGIWVGPSGGGPLPTANGRSSGGSTSVGGAMDVSESCCTETTTSTVPSVEPEPQLFSWSDLGLTYDEYERYGESGSESYAIGASWGGPAAERPLEVDLWGMTPVAGTPRGFVTVSTGSMAGDAVTAHFSTDGSSWVDSPLPASGWVNGVVSVDGGVIVMVGGDSEVEFWLGDETASGWQQVDVPGLPADGQVQLNGPGPGLVGSVDIYDSGSGGAAETAVADSGPIDFTVEVDGFVIDWHFDSAWPAEGDVSIEITEIATGEVRVSETFPASAEDPPEWAVEGDDELTFLDPATLEPIVVMPYSLQADAWDEAYADAGLDLPDDSETPAVEPDRWLVATSDGITWIVVDVGDQQWISAAAVSGTIAIADTGNGWSRFTP